MISEIKVQWLESLRSGKYKQGKGALRDSDNKFCCLGVLCDILAPDTWGDLTDVDTSVYKDGSHIISAYQNNKGNAEMISYELMVLAGVDSYEAVVLAEMNDSGYSFEVIADYIEKSL